jgi:hypothetical protein
MFTACGKLWQDGHYDIPHMHCKSFSFKTERIFRTTGTTDLHSSDCSNVCIQSLTCFFLNLTCQCVRGRKLSSAFLNSWDKEYWSEQNYTFLMNMKCNDTKGVEKERTEKDRHSEPY